MRPGSRGCTFLSPEQEDFTQRPHDPEEVEVRKRPENSHEHVLHSEVHARVVAQDSAPIPPDPMQEDVEDDGQQCLERLPVQVDSEMFKLSDPAPPLSVGGMEGGEGGGRERSEGSGLGRSANAITGGEWQCSETRPGGNGPVEREVQRQEGEEEKCSTTPHHDPIAPKLCVSGPNGSKSAVVCMPADDFWVCKLHTTADKEEDGGHEV
eukprot:752763-Hanusia_phi.AAC.1